jgi:hypothetical protein
MSPAALGILWAVMFAVPVSLLTRVRLRFKRGPRPASPPKRPTAHAGRGRPAQRATPVSVLSWTGAAWLLAINIVLLFVIDTLAFYDGRPMMTFAGLVPLILVNLVAVAITTTLSTRRRLNTGSVAAMLAIVTFRHCLDHRPEQRAQPLPGFAPGQRDGRAQRPAAREQHGQHGDRLLRHRHHQGLTGDG